MQYEVKTKKLAKSEMELEIELSADLLVGARKKALQNFSDSMDLPGFRKGHVPENIVIEKVGENTILEEATNILLQEHFPKIVLQEKLDVIGRPKISITKLALGNPMCFKAIFAVMPEFELPDYRAIARSAIAKAKADQKPSSTEVTADEVNDVLLQIRKNKAHIDWHNAHKDDKGHAHGGLDLEKEENLPPLDDELAKAAGNFKDLAELKNKIKENIIAEKKSREIEKTRAKIMAALTKNTKVDLPEILIESEIEKSLAQMKHDVERIKLKWDEYLAQTKKTEADLKKDFRQSSENKAKIQLIFNKIAEVEKLEPNKEILENETKNVMQNYPETTEQSAKIYVATILLNQAVLKLLENQ